MKMTKTLALIVTLTTLLGFAGLAYANVTRDQCIAGGGHVVEAPDNSTFCIDGQFDQQDI